jgi:hypothetical protein
VLGEPEQTIDSQSAAAPHGDVLVQSGEQDGGSHSASAVKVVPTRQPPIVRQQVPEAHCELVSQRAPSWQLGAQAGRVHLEFVQTSDSQSPGSPHTLPSGQ